MTAATAFSGVLLRTLPGWPTEVDPGAFSVLMLCILGPLALGVVVAVIAFARRLTHPEEPGGLPQNVVLTPDEERAEIGRIQSMTSLGQAMLAENPEPDLPDPAPAH